MSCNNYLDIRKIPRRYFLYVCNNMRKMAGLPMRRKKYLNKDYSIKKVVK